MPDNNNTQEILVSIAELRGTTNQLKKDVNEVKKHISMLPCSIHEADLIQLKMKVKIWVVILWTLAGIFGGLSGALGTAAMNYILR